MKKQIINRLILLFVAFFLSVTDFSLFGLAEDKEIYMIRYDPEILTDHTFIPKKDLGEVEPEPIPIKYGMKYLTQGE